MSTKRKPPTKIVHPVITQSAKAPVKANINESNTAVSVPDITKTNDVSNEQVIEISSDSGSSEYDFTDDERDASATRKLDSKIQSETEAPKARSTNDIQPKPQEANGDADIDMPSPKPPTDGESDRESAQPTFGELARAHDTIDVPAAVSTQSASLPTPGKALVPPSLSSLGTVLSQALRTDDSDLLESCLHTTDLNTIRNTIQRLDSTLAGTLLIKLASRMHRRPGRAGSLMTWVQWTLVSHGGALATQPKLTKKLGELHRVLEERSRGLNSLLALKGKLDLLEAQMELRRDLQRNADSDDDEEGIVYVEGEESGAEMANGGMDLDDEDDELPVTNGIAEDDSEDEESSESEEDEVALEGEEDLDENEVVHDDIESDDEDSEPEVAEPQRPVKRSRKRR